MRSTVIAILFFILFFLFVLLLDRSGPVIQIRKNSQAAFSIPRGFLYQLFRPEQKDLLTQEVKINNLVSEIDNLKKENEAFRSQFESAFIPASKLLPAKIVGFIGPAHAPHTFILNQGSKSGVKHGMGVVFQDHLIGIIHKTSEEYSEVHLPIHEDFKILGEIAGKDASGVVVGGGGEIHFENVVSSIDIAPNDVVRTQRNQSIDGQSISDGIIIGKLVEINTDRSVPLKSGKLKSYIVFPNLHTVFIVK